MPSELRILITFVGYSEFVAFAFNFGSKNEAFARKVAAYSAYAVSYSDRHGKERGKKALTR